MMAYLRKTYLFYPICILLMAWLCISACTQVKNITKSDVDLITDLYLEEIDEHIRSLSIFLYEKNPEQLDKGQTKQIESRLAQIVDYPLAVNYVELYYRKDNDAVRLALQDSYQGDRVFALMVGISGMLRRSYNGHRELFITDRLDAQKLYNSSVNIERIQDILNQDSYRHILNTGSTKDQDSFNNTMVRIATLQKTLSEIYANRNHSHINKIIKGTATILLPV